MSDGLSGTPGSWEQLSLIAADSVEIRLRIGITRSTEHCQVQIEVVNPSTGDLIAMVSHPHVVPDALPDRLDACCREVERRCQEFLWPF